MKIFNQTTIMVVGKAEPTKSQDGKNTYYRVACLQNGQATNLSVSEDTYYAIPEGISEVVFETSFDDKYNNFRIERLLQVISENGVKRGDKSSAASGASAAPAK